LLHRARGLPPPPVPPGAARRSRDEGDGAEGGGEDPLGAAWEHEYTRDAWEGARSKPMLASPLNQCGTGGTVRRGGEEG
jgi:hypothetical protein